MENEPQFVDGMIVKKPRAGAPDFIKASISIKKEEFFPFLQKHEGNWLNIDIKESRGGKWYAQVNTWKPEKKEENHEASDDFEVPF